MGTRYFRNPEGNRWLDGKRTLYRRGRWVDSRMAQPGDVLKVEDEDESAPKGFVEVSGPAGDEPAEEGGKGDGNEELLDVSEYETKPGSNWFDIPGQESKIQGAEKARAALAEYLASQDADDDDADGDDGDES